MILSDYLKFAWFDLVTRSSIFFVQASEVMLKTLICLKIMSAIK